MRLKNGASLTFRVADSSGPNGYVFWSADCYWPATYFVRGESWEDAYAWLLCDDRFVRQNKVEDVDIDDEMRRDIEAGTDMHGADFNDSGVLVWTEAVNGVELETFMRQERW